MTNKMLIDAAHPEETRVVVIRDDRIAEYDFESEHKKQIKGNIYLARVTRIEPSLQAAFVEYGGNRQGFLAFGEIHPDYYQIPLKERQQLKQNKPQHNDALAQDSENSENEANDKAEKGEHSDNNALTEDANVDNVNSKRPALQYKIQDVIKKRQIILVQIIKEERGNKGAALTTYLSLAGRYSVLMPNTDRGGGISRKITNLQDRKRLKDIVKSLNPPEGIGVILRTAGANRTKTEIKRDYDYLIRLWNTVRELTLNSVAPALVYEEGSLIKRSIRDLYDKSIEQILVAGDSAYREAKSFIRMLMPSQTKVVQPYRDPHPIFAHNNIEAQLDKMLEPQVNLRSGGYLIINQTEALVAIDVNSGKATKEASIEETAYQTNIEAADEIALQLKLRDLAGLVVIDFIDMGDKKNIRKVEKRLKDSLKADRARIQIGKISEFGLLEMSRQRLRSSVLESTTHSCTQCGGTGYIRSQSSIALHVVRSIEDYLLQNPNYNIIVKTSVDTALYMLNNKRQIVTDLEQRFKLLITITADDNIGIQHFVIEKQSLSDYATAQNAVKTLEFFKKEESVKKEKSEKSFAKAKAGANKQAQGAEKTPASSQATAKQDSAKAHAPHKQEADSLIKDAEGARQKGAPAPLTEHSEAKQENSAGKINEENFSNKRKRRGRRGGRRHKMLDKKNHMQDQSQAPASSQYLASSPPPEAARLPQTPSDASATSEAASSGAMINGPIADSRRPKEQGQHSPNQEGARQNNAQEASPEGQSQSAPRQDSQSSKQQKAKPQPAKPQKTKAQTQAPQEQAKQISEDQAAPPAADTPGAAPEIVAQITDAPKSRAPRQTKPADLPLADKEAASLPAKGRKAKISQTKLTNHEQSTDNSSQANDAKAAVPSSKAKRRPARLAKEAQDKASQELASASNEEKAPIISAKEQAEAESAAAPDKKPRRTAKKPAPKAAAPQNIAEPSPAGQGPFGQGPVGRNPFGRSASAQSASAQSAFAQSAFAQGPSGHNPSEQSSSGQSPAAQSPAAQPPTGQHPAGQEALGQPPVGHNPSGPGSAALEQAIASSKKTAPSEQGTSMPGTSRQNSKAQKTKGQSVKNKQQPASQSAPAEAAGPEPAIADSMPAPTASAAITEPAPRSAPSSDQQGAQAKAANSKKTGPKRKQKTPAPQAPSEPNNQISEQIAAPLTAAKEAKKPRAPSTSRGKSTKTASKKSQLTAIEQGKPPAKQLDSGALAPSQSDKLSETIS